MTRAEALSDLRDNFGEVSEHDLPGEPGVTFAVVETPQLVLGTVHHTKVGFKLPDVVGARPLQFVEPHVHLRSGGDPNNAGVQEVGGTLMKTWSLSTTWDPNRHRMSQLVDTVLSIWDR